MNLDYKIYTLYVQNKTQVRFISFDLKVKSSIMCSFYDAKKRYPFYAAFRMVIGIGIKPQEDFPVFKFYLMF